VRFEQFRQVFDFGAAGIPKPHMAPVAESSSADHGWQSESDSSKARPDARKKHQYVEIAG
jgi:hypothetical protein